MADESSIDIELMISLVQQKPILWDKTTEMYKNRVATQNAWKDVMSILNPGFANMEEKSRQGYAKQIIQKWTHIRDNYNRSIKKIKDQKRSGNSAKTIKPYIYSKQLSFLRKVIAPNETVDNLVANNINTASESEENIPETQETTELNTTTDISNVVTKNPIPKRVSKRPMANNLNPVDQKMMKFMDSYVCEEPKQTNRHLSFFNGILPTLDKFEDDEVLEFQMGVLQLLKNIKANRGNSQLLTFNADMNSETNSTVSLQHSGTEGQQSFSTIQTPLESPQSIQSVSSNYSIIDFSDF